MKYEPTTALMTVGGNRSLHRRTQSSAVCTDLYSMRARTVGGSPCA